MDDIQYVEGTAEDFKFATKAANESDGWVLAADDFVYFKRAFRDNALFVVAKTPQGDFVGCCMALISDELAFMGMYYVVPGYRSKGIGHKLFKAVSPEYLSRMNVGLHSAPNMSPIYESKLGFVEYTDWVSDILTLSDIELSRVNDVDGSLQIKIPTEADSGELIEYDAKLTNMRRDEYLRKCFLERDNCFCKIITDSNGKIVGYGRTLLTQVGSPLIGPLYSDSAAGFLALFKALAQCFPEHLRDGFRYGIRCPSTKTNEIIELLSGAAKIKKEAHCVPQFTKFVPVVELSKVYALSDLSLYI